MKSDDNSAVVSTGVDGLDEVMHGGFTQGETFLVEGHPGAGKTMLALQWAMDGMRKGEPALFVGFAETQSELNKIAHSNGWDLSGLNVLEIARPEDQHTLFHPSEVELDKTLNRLRDELDRMKPTRLILDSLTELRLMAETPFRYYRELLALKNLLHDRKCTTLLTDSPAQMAAQTLVSGLISLEQYFPEYGGVRRRLSLHKMRGRDYADGYHDYIIVKGGLQVFPRVVAAEHRTQPPSRLLSSGVDSVDQLLNGGITSGTSTLIVGPAGSGKSSMAIAFAAAAAKRGEPVTIYTFDEPPETLLSQSDLIGASIEKYIETGLVRVQQVDPVEFSPHQLAHLIRTEVEKRNISVLVIDSINGYVHAMPEAQFLTAQMHELLAYLGQQGVSSIIIMGQYGLTDAVLAPVNASYLTDNLISLRLFEFNGEMRRAIAVIKRRGGTHKNTIHEITLGPSGIEVGGLMPTFYNGHGPPGNSAVL